MYRGSSQGARWLWIRNPKEPEERELVLAALLRLGCSGDEELRRGPRGALRRRELKGEGVRWGEASESSLVAKTVNPGR